MDYLVRSIGMKAELIANRRFLHQNPETGFDLPVTKKFVWDRLVEMGYQPCECGRSGIMALVGQGTKTVLLRADMDALPMHEESGLPFASLTDKAHTCGHDMHTTMLLGAAKMLKENEENLNGQVKLMFQPAEEILEGAKDMIAAGILANPSVDVAIGCHMLPQAPTGKIIYNTGIVTASSDSLDFDIYGKGGHGAQPDESIDPINIGAHLHLTLQELISREVNPEDAVVLTIGTFQAGEAHNIIPEAAKLRGTLRTFRPEVREFMLKRIDEMTKLTSEAFHGNGVFSVTASVGSLVVCKEVADIVSSSWQAVLGNDEVIRLSQAVNGSEDFSEISQRVPSLFFALGAGSAEEGYHYGLHNPKVIFNEEALPIGAAAYAIAATEWLCNQQLIASEYQEFQEEMVYNQNIVMRNRPLHPHQYGK